MIGDYYLMSFGERGSVTIPKELVQGVSSWLLVRWRHRLLLLTEDEWEACYRRLAAMFKGEELSRTQRILCASSFPVSLGIGRRIYVPSCVREKPGYSEQSRAVIRKGGV